MSVANLHCSCQALLGPVPRWLIVEAVLEMSVLRLIYPLNSKYPWVVRTALFGVPPPVELALVRRAFLP